MAVLDKLHHFFSYTLPAIVRPLAAHVRGSSPTSSRCDFFLVMLVAIIRIFFNDPRPISMLEQQAESTAETGVRGPLWVIPDEFPLPSSTNLKDKLGDAVRGLLGRSLKVNCDDIEVSPVHGEWVGNRKGVGKHQPDPDLSVPVKYHQMLRETTRSIIVLFLHGGQFFMRSPASRRSLTAELARQCSGRCFALRYRLAPQNPFPAALLDCLVAYLSLLYPAQGSLHESIAASDICLAGDSSGANICLALLQVILELQRQSPDGRARIFWQGCERVLPFPAAVTTHSGVLDMTRSLPSETTNLPFDVLPDPHGPPYPKTKYRPSAIWPTVPPRHSVYTTDEMLLHPLVSPVLATDWRGCPTRIWLSVGEECLADGNFVVAQRAISQGVFVSMEQYLCMPHDFVLPPPLASRESGKHCLSRWAGFMCEAVDQPLETSFQPGFTVVDLSGRASEMGLVEEHFSMYTESIRAGMERQIQSWERSVSKARPGHRQELL